MVAHRIYKFKPENKIIRVSPARVISCISQKNQLREEIGNMTPEELEQKKKKSKNIK